LETGRTPRLLTGHHKPDLLPCHPDFQLNQPDPDAMADALTRWAGEWDREFVVVDTHGGGSPSGDGALAAATMVVVPAPLRTKDLNAVEGMVREMPDYPLVIVPNMVGRVPGAAEITRLARIVEGTPDHGGRSRPVRARHRDQEEARGHHLRGPHPQALPGLRGCPARSCRLREGLRECLNHAPMGSRASMRNAYVPAGPCHLPDTPPRRPRRRRFSRRSSPPSQRRGNP